MGIEFYPIKKERFYSYKPGDIGILEVTKYVVAINVIQIQGIDAWTTSDDIDREFDDDDFLHDVDYRSPLYS